MILLALADQEDELGDADISPEDEEWLGHAQHIYRRLAEAVYLMDGTRWVPPDDLQS